MQRYIDLSSRGRFWSCTLLLFFIGCLVFLLLFLTGRLVLLLLLLLIGCPVLLLLFLVWCPVLSLLLNERFIFPLFLIWSLHSFSCKLTLQYISWCLNHLLLFFPRFRCPLFGWSLNFRIFTFNESTQKMNFSIIFGSYWLQRGTEILKCFYGLTLLSFQNFFLHP